MLEETGISVEVATNAQAIGGGDPPAIEIVLAFQKKAEATNIVRASVLDKSAGRASSNTDPAGAQGPIRQKVGGNGCPVVAVDAQVSRIHQ